MIQLAWPPASLSGHSGGGFARGGHWRAKAQITGKHREWARAATLAANVPLVAGTGDIRLGITFYPPDRRGDRTNYPNRIKPALDGIADALKVNDRRFLPTYHFAEPVGAAKACVVVTVNP